MGTRATYSFIKNDMHPTITVYIHWDGYPEGAALYFINMLESEGKGGWLDKFIKGNADQTEITLSHEIHGDTEYRYTIEEIKGTLNLKAWEGYDENWECLFDGELAEFLNQYAKKSRSAPVIGTDTQLTLLKQFKQYFFYAVECAEKGWIGNGAGSISRAIEVGQKLVPVRDNPAIQAFLANIDNWYKAQFKKDDTPKPSKDIVINAGKYVQWLLTGKKDDDQLAEDTYNDQQADEMYAALTQGDIELAPPDHDLF